jgi:hypothetical protein
MRMGQAEEEEEVGRSACGEMCRKEGQPCLHLSLLSLFSLLVGESEQSGSVGVAFSFVILLVLSVCEHIRSRGERKWFHLT